MRFLWREASWVRFAIQFFFAGLNGVETVDLPDDAQGSLEGHLALQAHGSKRETEIWFKDIEVLTAEVK